MAGSIDLAAMLETLTVSRRPGAYTLVALPDGADVPVVAGPIEAVIRELEAVTIVTTVDHARVNGWVVDFEAAWLTLDVHSSLDAVGLTAAVSTVLADQGIPCNVLAGFHHDHLLVPVDRAEAAIAALEALRA